MVEENVMVPVGLYREAQKRIRELAGEVKTLEKTVREYRSKRAEAFVDAGKYQKVAKPIPLAAAIERVAEAADKHPSRYLKIMCGIGNKGVELWPDVINAKSYAEAAAWLEPAGQPDSPVKAVAKPVAVLVPTPELKAFLENVRHGGIVGVIREIDARLRNLESKS